LGVHARPQEKGGSTPLAELEVKPADHDVEGCLLVSDARGDLGERAILYEESAHGLVTAVEGELRVEEVTTTELTVHGSGIHQLTVFCPLRGFSSSPVVPLAKRIRNYGTMFSGRKRPFPSTLPDLEPTLF
jgi:hypothetical protein